jgi:hypothetical protein
LAAEIPVGEPLLAVIMKIHGTYPHVVIGIPRELDLVS